MSYAYGALKKDPLDFKAEYEFFPVTAEVGELITTVPNGNAKVWPYFPVILRRGDNQEVIATTSIDRPVDGFIVDESNVFDLLEYQVHTRGESNIKPGSRQSVYDSFLRDPHNLYDNVTLKRAVGCRHFVFNGRGTPTVHVTAWGVGINSASARHEVNDLLIVKNTSEGKMAQWWSGCNEFCYSFNMITTPLRNHLTYEIPFAAPTTPREISKRQIISSKVYAQDPTIFAGPPSSYNPFRLLKKVHKAGFWYLISGDQTLILTFIKDPSITALGAVFAEMKDMKLDDRRPLELLFSEWMATTTINYSGKEREKAIVLNAIQMLEKIADRKLALEESIAA